MGIKTYKGTDEKMRCRGYQFEIRKTFEDDGAIRCGDKGFHSCEAPLDVFRYYPPATSRYFECEADGVIDRTGADDSKVACSKLTLKREIGIPGLVKAQVEWIRANIQRTVNVGDNNAVAVGSNEAAAAGDGGSAAAGDWGSAAAGDRGSAAAGDWGSAAAGDWGSAVSRGSAAAGDNGLAVVRGNGVKAKGGIGAVLVIANENDTTRDVSAWKAGVVDGEIIKADTWYTLKNGEFVEVPDDAD